LASSKGVLRILVADDDPQITKLYREALGTLGHLVSTVQNGGEALRTLESGSFALLITDYHMPGLSGLQVVQELRRRRLQTPVLLVSSHLPEDVRSACAADPLVSLMEKPFSLEELREAIEQAVRVRN
jgi:CheY-like chemotaxis protein